MVFVFYIVLAPNIAMFRSLAISRAFTLLAVAPLCVNLSLDSVSLS